jgi:hypothetical protein
MIFWAWVAAAIAYLLLVAFTFSQLFAWRDRAAERAEEKHLRKLAAARYLSRFHHVRLCDCGRIEETNLVHLGIQCLAWTRKLDRVAAEIRRFRIRTALREVARKRNERGANPARNPTSLN